MRKDLLYLLGEIIVVGVYRVLILRRLRDDEPVFCRQRPYRFAAGGVVGYILGDDVHRPRQRGAGVGNSLLLADIVGGDLLERTVIGIGLRLDQLRERLEALLPRHRRSRLALRSEGAVDVVDLGERRRRVYRRRDLGGERALGVDERLDLFPALLDPAQIGEPVVEIAQDGVVKRAGDLLAVSGDEGDGVALVDERDGLCDLFLAEFEFLGQYLFN